MLRIPPVFQYFSGVDEAASQLCPGFRHGFLSQLLLICFLAAKTLYFLKIWIYVLKFSRYYQLVGLSEGAKGNVQGNIKKIDFQQVNI